MKCALCNAEFQLPPELAAVDKLFESTFGGGPGAVCDPCCATLMESAPEEVERLLERAEENGPPAVIYGYDESTSLDPSRH